MLQRLYRIYKAHQEMQACRVVNINGMCHSPGLTTSTQKTQTQTGASRSSPQSDQTAPVITVPQEQLAKAFDPVVQTCLKTNTAMQEQVMEKNHGHDSSEETQQVPVKTDHAHASTEVTDPLPVTIDHAHDSADEIQQLPEKTVHAHGSSEEIRQLSQEQEQLEKALDQQSNDDHEYDSAEETQQLSVKTHHDAAAKTCPGKNDAAMLAKAMEIKRRTSITASSDAPATSRKRRLSSNINTGLLAPGSRRRSLKNSPNAEISHNASSNEESSQEQLSSSNGVSFGSFLGGAFLAETPHRRSSDGQTGHQKIPPQRSWFEDFTSLFDFGCAAKERGADLVDTDSSGDDAETEFLSL
jgi:hypothetical protein